MKAPGRFDWREFLLGTLVFWGTIGVGFFAWVALSWVP